VCGEVRKKGLKEGAADVPRQPVCTSIHTFMAVGFGNRQLWKLLSLTALTPGLTCIVGVIVGVIVALSNSWVVRYKMFFYEESK